MGENGRVADVERAREAPDPAEVEESIRSTLRPLLADVDGLVRAVAAGYRRRARPRFERVDLRPVDLKAGRRLQVVTRESGGSPLTRNYAPGPELEAALDELLAEPFGTWHVESSDRVVQVRLTKRGKVLVHSGVPSRRSIEPSPAGSGHDRRKEHLLDADDPLFAALGADADKRRQVDAFLRQIKAATADLISARRTASTDMVGPLRVVDLGCGNAYLTFAAHRWLSGLPHLKGCGVATVGIDQRADMVARNTGLATHLGLAGLTFAHGTIEQADPGLDGVDVVLALHACDTATDDALARAVRWQAPVVLAAPCCHHDVQRQIAAARAAGQAPAHPYEGVVRHAILAQRFADVLTDALRADLLRLLGYTVEVVEFVDSRHTPRNALIRARRGAHVAAAADDVAVGYLDLTRAWGLSPALHRLLAPEVDLVLGRTP